MRRVILVCALAGACAVATAGAQSRPVRSDQEILMQLERDWDGAFLRRDVRTIDNILAEEFIATYDDGTRGDRAKELSLAAEFNQQIQSSALEDFTVKIYGDTAVVWFTRRVVGLSQGRPLALAFQYVDVFVFRAGRWQAVASQSTRVAGKS
jgi:ketosteroid isomerase-like protein